jgi:Kdo2-lipid IVA lauroyltransferase/acyltransferase
MATSFLAAAGLSKQRSALRNQTELLFVRCLFAVLRLLPLRKAMKMASQLVSLYVMNSSLRRVVHANARIAGFSEALVLQGAVQCWGRVIATLAHLPRLKRDNIRQWIDYEGFEHFEMAKQRGKGVLFATAHLGNWELSAYAHALMAEPMMVVTRPLDNPLLEAMVAGLRSSSGNALFGRESFARTVLTALKQNKAVGILIDQNVIDQPVFVRFFGHAASTEVNFVKLAHKTGAAVIPGYALWSEAKQRFVLRFFPIMEMSGDAAADTQRLHSHLEQVIRDHPDQWNWIHRRWKTQPPGRASLY